MPSIKKNFFYNGLLTVANYLFPLITYPYVSRVLGVSNIGICNFVDSIVNYFILFSMMGISIVGVREIAAVREDREARNRVFSNLIALNGLTSGWLPLRWPEPSFSFPPWRRTGAFFGSVS
jgi:Membrane protein involved in the export of O-antigen and teichoic acid